jgi:hypothetical protein
MHGITAMSKPFRVFLLEVPYVSPVAGQLVVIPLLPNKKLAGYPRAARQSSFDITLN